MNKIILPAAGAVLAVGVIVGGGMAYQHSYDKSQQPEVASGVPHDSSQSQLTAQASDSAQTQPAQAEAKVGQSTQPTQPIADPKPGQILITDEKVGTGAAAQSGQTLTVNYLGTYTDGVKFDSSYDRNQPFSFPLGAGRVITGWDKGMVGMKVGGKRKLVIASDLAYGANPPQGIRPNAALVFEVELLAVK